MILFVLVLVVDAKAQAELTVPACRVEVAEGPGPHGGTQFSLGSGVVIGEGEQVSYVLTNWHVVSECRGAVTVTFLGAGSMRAKIAATDELWDMALLEMPRLGITPVEIAPEAPRVGEIVHAGGFGPEGAWKQVTGQVVKYVSPDNGKTYDTLEFAGATRQGDSGGPIVNERGELVALLWGSDGQVVTGSQVGRVIEFCQCFGGRCQPCPPRWGGGWVQQGPPQGSGFGVQGNGREARQVFGGRQTPTTPVRKLPADDQYRAPVADPPLVDVGTGNAKAPADCRCDPAIVGRVQKLERLAGLLEQELAKGGLSSLPGPAGPPGKDGRDGKDGIDGAPGPAGKAGTVAEIDLDALAEKLAAKVGCECAETPGADASGSVAAGSVDIDQLASEVQKRLPRSPAYFEIRPRSRGTSGR
jgi:hypothetical protein